MKATGIVRRIDDLGRVVIPKEIRRTLRIREGDPLEIFLEKDGSGKPMVCFVKYSPLNMEDSYVNSIASALKAERAAFAIFSMDECLVQNLTRMTGFRLPSVDRLIATEDGRALYFDAELNCAVAPVMADGELYGFVVIGKKDCDMATSAAMDKARFIASVLSNQFKS